MNQTIWMAALMVLGISVFAEGLQLRNFKLNELLKNNKIFDYSDMATDAKDGKFGNPPAIFDGKTNLIIQKYSDGGRIVSLEFIPEVQWKAEALIFCAKDWSGIDKNIRFALLMTPSGTLRAIIGNKNGEPVYVKNPTALKSGEKANVRLLLEDNKVILTVNDHRIEHALPEGHQLQDSAWLVIGAHYDSYLQKAIEGKASGDAVLSKDYDSWVATERAKNPAFEPSAYSMYYRGAINHIMIKDEDK